jgi:hypothetical protein
MTLPGFNVPCSHMYRKYSDHVHLPFPSSFPLPLPWLPSLILTFCILVLYCLNFHYSVEFSISILPVNILFNQSNPPINLPYFSPYLVLFSVQLILSFSYSDAMLLQYSLLFSFFIFLPLFPSNSPLFETHYEYICIDVNASIMFVSIFHIGRKIWNWRTLMLNETTKFRKRISWTSLTLLNFSYILCTVFLISLILCVLSKLSSLLSKHC